MNRDQALDVLDTIDDLYEKYDLTQRKVKILLPQLMKMDYDRVLQRLSSFVAEYSYAPTLAEIAAYPPVPNTFVEQVQQWKLEADQVPEETKRQFKEQIEQLFKERGV